MDNSFVERVLGLEGEQINAIFNTFFKEISALTSVMEYPYIFLIYCVWTLREAGSNVNTESLMDCAEKLLSDVGERCLGLLLQSDVENGLKMKARNFQTREVTLSNEARVSDNVSSVSDKQTSASSREDGQKGSSRAVAGQHGRDEVDGFLTSGDVDFTALSGAALDYSEISAQASGDDTTTEHTGAWALASVGSSLATVNTSVDQDTRITRRDRNNFSRVEEHLMAVKNENTILEGERKCLQCRRSPRGVTFLPCGHFTTCRECSVPMYVCSLCNKNILATVDTYLS
ncbi:baculoviral IAP repeat-containing protein 3-like [Physella acuta]|uniref:baculoviral IAP repeat-containing protein 3-like n=1 Tax=Physella acuta TaxID=109671 RepID=UPI0027DB994D|nr:baculoviral IAP repeat-containing protein 3-like [Physella acuta]XP_059179001.1 baculoviral IAP repeat-containing protein 3-like [Physella acuta]XP_059179002.1 baculoviral IAP repeat-containing protein 3-like [Physella acuta]XP_059179003.1 baculoviral IAP repeat-containing protein 3-like [Physella acuta]XP_059179004.1 baculoviral IAP repeat-containing protein 3-like [Physella acuta]XP_059179005.1 baculoviral IAP repeat-containing protein 3-like [Physella acuta]XP_059179006.1 baculoviral IA